ncbi:hypothetical protein V1477_014984 [Vespula maculifrons]|uniref:Uncharacterized protein n=1 Tax=Vespula maculifrons TaxID=7453 RepID=A0ABD2BJ03_VESMC
MGNRKAIDKEIGLYYTKVKGLHFSNPTRLFRKEFFLLIYYRTALERIINHVAYIVYFKLKINSLKEVANKNKYFTLCKLTRTCKKKKINKKERLFAYQISSSIEKKKERDQRQRRIELKEYKKKKWKKKKYSARVCSYNAIKREKKKGKKP